MSIMFNQICINEEMLPIYIYIYIYNEKKNTYINVGNIKIINQIC